MRHLNALGDAALLDRIERLERAEHCLQQSAMALVSRAEAEGVWQRSNPSYRYLSSLLTKVRGDLLKTENEFLRRGTRGLKQVA